MAHLDELRWRIVKVATAVVLGAIVGWFLREWFADLLIAPYEDVFPGRELIALRPTEKFSVALRLAFGGGFILASPVVFYQAWAFVSPGLTQREKRWTFPIVGALVMLFVVGVGFAYLVLPRSLQILDSVLDSESTYTLSDYMGFSLRFLLVFGLTFEFPVFLFALGAAGVVGSAQLRRGRRWAVLVIIIVAAAATPTGEPFTLFILAGPLYLMYEGTLWLIRLLLRK